MTNRTLCDECGNWVGGGVAHDMTCPRRGEYTTSSDGGVGFYGFRGGNDLERSISRLESAKELDKTEDKNTMRKLLRWVREDINDLLGRLEHGGGEDNE